MPYRFDLDPVNRILRVRYVGQIGDELIKECYQATPQAVTRTNPRAVIIDLSEATAFDVSPQTIHELARFKPTVKDPSVPRIIVAPTAYMFGMARMFQIMGGQTRPMLQVMKSADEAYALLDVAKVKFEPLAKE